MKNSTKNHNYVCDHCRQPSTQCTCSHNTFKKSFIVLISFLLISFCTFAEGYLRIKGNTITQNNKKTEVIILITDENTGNIVKDIKCNGEFDIKLNLNTQYSVVFIKSGYMSKAININTETVASNNNYRFEFDVKMEKAYEQVDYLVVAYIFYDEILHYFNYAYIKQ